MPSMFWNENRGALSEIRRDFLYQSREKRIQVLREDLKKLCKVELTLRKRWQQIEQFKNRGVSGETLEERTILNDIKTLQQFISNPEFKRVRSQIISELNELGVADTPPPLLQA